MSIPQPYNFTHVGNIGQPYDRRIEATIVEILNSFFSDNKNSLIYVCDNLDNRQYVRYRKFDIWFNRNKSELLEKYDVDFSFQDMQIFTSLIVHVHNPEKDVIVGLFFDIYK